MSKTIKRFFYIIMTAAAALCLCLCLAACSDKSAASVESEIEAAISIANARITVYRQTDGAFADTLMHHLPGACVYDEDSGYLIRYKGNNYKYADSLTKTDDSYAFYPTLAAAAEGATVGQTVYTLGYGSELDGGCARYTVSAEPTSEICEKAGELYLNYQTGRKKISLKQMGYTGADLDAYIKRFESFKDINTLVFPAGEYALYDAVRSDRDGVNYYGIEATIYSPDGFGGTVNKTYDSLWSVRRRWGDSKIVTGQRYSGLNFEMRQKTYNTRLEGVKGLNYLMQISNCKDISFYNCNFLVPYGLYDDLKSYSTHCVDCFTQWENVTFDGCAFENYSYANAGGAIGFRDVWNTGCEGLTFTHNLVVSSARDEGVALFAGQDKRFHPEDWEYGKGYIKHCRLENNTFKAPEAAEGLDPRTMFLTVGYQLSPVYDIKYINNTFEGYCNSYFLHYCYCYGLEFKGNTVNIRQSGDTKRMTLIWHNDSPEASDITVEDNTFNLLGDNFRLNSVTMTSPYSDGEELTFKNNVVNLPEGYADTVIASDATVKDNTFNMNRVGSVYYRTCGDISGNTYNIGKLEKSGFEFYNANVKHDLAVKKEKLHVDTALCNLLMFNGDNIRLNGHSLLFEDVDFDVKKVEKNYYYLCWSTDKITDTVTPITFRRCSFGAYDGHLQIAGGDKHVLTIEN